MYYSNDGILDSVDKAIANYDKAKLKALRLEQLRLLEAIDSLSQIDFDYFGQFMPKEEYGE